MPLSSHSPHASLGSDRDSGADSTRSLLSSGRKSPDPFRRFRRLSSATSLNLSASNHSDVSQTDLASQKHATPSTPSAPTSPVAASLATGSRTTYENGTASFSSLDGPKSPPPPRPSSASKPAFTRPKRSKSSSISILSSGLGFRPRGDSITSIVSTNAVSGNGVHGEDGLRSPIASTAAERKARHRKSASLSGSESFLSSPAFGSVGPQSSLSLSSDAMYVHPGERLRRPSSPSSFCARSDSSHSITSTPAYQSKQHKQAWYQAQQKTIELEKRPNGSHDSSTASLFPINITTSPSTASNANHPSSSSSASSLSTQPTQQTFLSEEEIIAAGIHIIRRRDPVELPTATPLLSADPAASTGSSTKQGENIATVGEQQRARSPVPPPRLEGAEQPDFLELIDSPVDSQQASPNLEQLVYPPSASLDATATSPGSPAFSPSSGGQTMMRNGSRAKSGSGSISVSPYNSSEQLPRSGSQDRHLVGGAGFSFAKFRRGGASSNASGSRRPSTANSIEDPDLRGFLLPHQPISAPASAASTSTAAMASAAAATPISPSLGYLSPVPAASASPFLNKHSATVGRAAGQASGSGHTVKLGLAQMYHDSITSSTGTSSTTATNGTASARSDLSTAMRLEETPPSKPPRPPKPKPSLLSAFPRQHKAHGESISAPNTASMASVYDVRSTFGTSPSAYPPPSSASLSSSAASSSSLANQVYGSETDSSGHGQPASNRSGNGLFRLASQTRSQEDLLSDPRLDAEALRASAGTPMPPPRRTHHGSRPSAPSAYLQQPSAPMMRSVSGGGVAGALGQVGQIGAAMGRKGWDFVKTFQGSSSNSSGGAGSSRIGVGSHSARSPTSARGGNTWDPTASAVSSLGENEATRRWFAFVNRAEAARPGAGIPDRGGIFGLSLKEAVLLSRLSNLTSSSSAGQTGAGASSAHSNDHLGIPDLGKDFSINFLESPRVTPRASVAGPEAEPYTRDEARHLFLPRLVVRCIESLEKWGFTEEGLYRVSGRSSHTSKLRAYFSDPRNDLELDQISPADLDINSVCSVLKSFLRELPEHLIPAERAGSFEQVISKLFSTTNFSMATAANDGSPAGLAALNAAAAKAGIPTQLASGPNKEGRAAAELKVAQIDAAVVERELTPLVRQLPLLNWYLLRELAQHLSELSQPSVVAQTKMPLSNLTLVLAPTVSISLPMLQILVVHQAVVFKGPAPVEDLSLDSSVAKKLAQASISESLQSLPSVVHRADKPRKPDKPDRLLSPSKLPTLARKRASSLSLATLLSSDKSSAPRSNIPSPSKAAPTGQVRSGRRISSTLSTLGVSPNSGKEVASSPPSPLAPADPYERPSTSLGHFDNAPPTKLSSPSRNRPLQGYTRDATLRYHALDLDEAAIGGARGPVTRARDGAGPVKSTRKVAGADRKSIESGTPIARYFARMRQPGEASASFDDADAEDRSSTPLAKRSATPTPSMTSASVDAQDASDASSLSSDVKTGHMHRYWADKVAASSPALSGRSAGVPERSGASSALDRPRPPTSSTASFFSGRSRRQDSVNDLASFKSPNLRGSGGGIGRSESRSRESSQGSAGHDSESAVGLGVGLNGVITSATGVTGSAERRQQDVKPLKISKRTPPSSANSDLGTGAHHMFRRNPQAETSNGYKPTQHRRGEVSEAEDGIEEKEQEQWQSADSTPRMAQQQDKVRSQIELFLDSDMDFDSRRKIFERRA
ncbi:hypothetical protein BCV70DRAFT_230075 [Testicularia cyperi]|uniref:Rho-GAP domain-containing protein n=1 Tax=Testicularia cyperi TaxID=1882483 RepID=A0A317XVD4_9BASI|nr:hypothetical protein BCV70DRAFT_230075 [Testicularia cyperi]